MAKRSKPTTRSDEVYLMIINRIKESGKLPSCKIMGMTKQNRQKYVTRLRELNIIVKIGYGVYKIDENLAQKFMQERSKLYTRVTHVDHRSPIHSVDKLFRLHNVMIKLYLPKFEYWHRRESLLKKKQISFTLIKYGRIHRIVYKDVIWHLNSDSITFYVPDNYNFISNSPYTSQHMAMAWSRDQIKYFSNYLGIDLKIGGKYKYSIVRMHVAEMNNEIATDLRHKKETLRIVENGKTWAETDFSNHIDEFEFLDAKQSPNDAYKLTKVFNTFRHNPELLEDMQKQMDTNEVHLLSTMKHVNTIMEVLSQNRETGFPTGYFLR